MIFRAAKCLLLWRISILGGAFKQERARKKKKKKGMGWGGGAGEGFQEVKVTYNIKIHAT